MTSSWRRGIAHPVQWMQDLVGDGPVYALLILFGLNAVDELDRTAFGVLLPEIRDDFGLGFQGILTLIAIVGGVALALQIPIAYYADRTNRVRMALAGAVAWGVFSFATGLATTLVMLAIVRVGSSLGRAVNDPTHNSLLADYFDVPYRPRVYSFHRAANAVGQFVGPLLAGVIAFYTSWRVPFLIFAVPTLVLVVLGLRLREPVRGARERAAAGASPEAVLTEEEPPSFAESWRIVWNIEALRRIWYAMPFLAAALIGFVSLASLLYEQEFGLNEAQRGFVAASVEPAQLVGLIVGARVGTRLIARDPGLVIRFLAGVALVVSAMAVAFALAPNVGVAIGANLVITGSLGLLLPGILAALSLAIPPRARSMGFSVTSLWIIPGLLLLPIIGAIGDAWGIRQGMLVMTPVFLAGGLMISTAGRVIDRDIKQVWRTAAALSEVRYERQQGRAKLLLVRELDVAYGDTQVLFGVDFEVDEGEIVALLGTNGAGKSTLLNAISGVVDPDAGAIIFDGREMTHTPPNEVAGRGVVQVPGGKGAFPTLTVRENLRVAGWLSRHRRDDLEAATDRVLELFPVLGDRLDDAAADLSGGQQQMLSLGMALITRPRLLMIDELSIGLAPVVVEQLLPVVEELRDRGTTVLLVEQSVNLALTIAEKAFFMEKGEIRFQGQTSELLDRPDVLRSVFLEGAGAGMAVAAGDGDGRRSPAAEATADHDDSAAERPTIEARGPAMEGIGLVRHFGGIRAIDDVDLEVAPGEILGLVGPNGAGKTTLFDVLCGFTRPDAGVVSLEGRDVTALPAFERARRGLGRSFQDARLFPALTVEETLAVAHERWIEVRDPVAAALHLPAVHDAEEAVRRQVDELIELLGLEAFRSKFVRELSTGSRRILDLACLVAHRPSVVLLDEPSSGIAQREAEALGPLLRGIRDQLGASVLLIEHDMPLVSSVAERMVALDQGRVIAEGVPTEVLRDPAVVESYLGTREDVIARSGDRSGSG